MLVGYYAAVGQDKAVVWLTRCPSEFAHHLYECLCSASEYFGSIYWKQKRGGLTCVE